MKKWVKIRVFGKVQGVYFRATAKEQAEYLGLEGIVKNMPDGTVYIEIYGDETVTDQFIHWSNEGPRFARVDKIDVEYLEGDPEFKSFTIIR